MVLVSSANSGISYVETSSLDGEKNLKPKFSLAPLQNHYNATHKFSLERLTGDIRCINPTAEIESFEGEISLKYI
jgi:phospholipid-translocating ATPase